MTWQIAAVVVVELFALAFIVHKLWPRHKRPRWLEKPDVKASDLVRKKR